MTTTTRRRRPCPVCTHPDRDAFEPDLADGEPIETFAEVYGLSKNSLRIHRRKHLSPELADRFQLYKDSLTWTMTDQRRLEGQIRKADALFADRFPDQQQQNAEHTAAMLARMRQAAEMNQARARRRARDPLSRVRMLLDRELTDGDERVCPPARASEVGPVPDQERAHPPTRGREEQADGME